MKRLLLVVTALLVLVLGGISCGPSAPPQEEGLVTKEELKVHFIDVGQGDSILVDLGETEILIDGGGKSPGVTAYLNNYVDGGLEVMIATHPHADHIGGLIAVLDAFDVQEVWHNGDSTTSQTYAVFIAAVQAEEAEVYEARRGDTIEVGELAFNVLHPVNLSGATNNNSIVLSLNYGEVDFLFTGDAEQEAESSMVNAGIVPDAEILKVGHHGSSSSSSAQFLDIVKPLLAIYMAGEGNSYGHPHQETIAALTQIGAEIYGTDIHGTIVVSTDGESYTIQKELYNLNVSVSPLEAGSVNPSGGDFSSGTEVTLTAVSNSGYVFMHWGGDVSGNFPSVTITMNSDKNVVAYFEKVAVTYNLTVSINGQGTTTLSPGVYTYDEGTQVTIHASPASSWRFDHWGGDASGSSTTVVITMDSNKNVVAYFEKVAVTYNLTVSINGQGTTTLSPGVYTYDEGTQVTIHASPASSWRFDHWGGDASGSSTTVVITMDSNKNVVAYFEKETCVGSNVQITYIFYDGLVYRTESDEYVEITNLGDTSQDLEGWVLKDISEGYPSFTFRQSYILAPGASIRVYTNEIHPEWGGFSFGFGKAIWQNAPPHDVAALYNAQGQKVSEKSY